MRTVALFCSVVDNFGDIGICWRLARQLVHEHQWQVQLFVDDLASFARICPQVALDIPFQCVAQVQVIHWHRGLVAMWQRQSMTSVDETLGVQLATPDVVIEALACTVPVSYLQHVAAKNPQALWLNLEYLSAEDWVEGCHGLPSPQSLVPLTKYFFFPGFTGATGGLLREQTIVHQAQQLQRDVLAQRAFWQQLGIADAEQFQLKISMFAYGQANILPWLSSLQAQGPRTLMLVPQGVLAEQICMIYPELAAERFTLQRLDLGQLTLVVMPFIAQQDYDVLLACCDINFVRGEDSVIRAHWAGRPFIWQIYRQEQQVHRQKLNDFLAKQLAFATPELAALIQKAHDWWDLELDFTEIWPEYLKNIQEIQNHTIIWQQFLTQQQDLASNLVRFAEKKLIMPRNFS